MQWQVSLNNDSFDRAGITKDSKDAVCEYIWNSFEAGASKVSVTVVGTPLQEAMSLAISDNGTGIAYDGLDKTFGTFLASQKNNATVRLKSQANKGKGRFSYLSFSHCAKWHTVYCSDGKLMQYTISTNSANRSQFDTTEPLEVTDVTETGTVVVLSLNDSASIDMLSSFDAMKQKLLEEFAWYLFLNKDKGYTLEYAGVPLDISEYIRTDLSRTCSCKIDTNDFAIDVIVWNSSVSNTSKIYYLTEKGEIVATKNTSFNKNTVNFYHAVFVSSKYFVPDMLIPAEDDDGQVEIDLFSQAEQRLVFRELNKKIRLLVTDVFKSFLIQQANVALSRMERDGNYPKFPDDEYGQLRKKDFETITREIYCVEPRIFHRLSAQQEKSLLGFLNLLLSTEERENVLQIIEQVVNLTSEQRESFANILKRSQLQYIVEAISIIEKRITVIEGLKKIVFDCHKFANERDHVQKLIEHHFWLFGEQYHMLTADKNMRVSLREFEKITAQGPSDDALNISDNEALQRMDIFLYSNHVLDNNNIEMLIVELKAPHIKLSLDVFNQITRYANTIRKEPRFASGSRVWRFYAICAEIDDDVKTKYKNFEQHGKKGLADIVENFELYALSWDDVFQAFEARHNFLLSKLKLDYAQVSTDLGIPQDAPRSRADVTDIAHTLLATNA